MFGPLDFYPQLGEIIASLGTGRARMSSGAVTRHVWFDNGAVVGATSSSDDEKLGGWLVLRGMVPPQTMRETLASLPQGERLGTYLVRTNRLSPENLRKELETLTVTLICRAALAGGEMAGETGTSLPADHWSVSGPLSALLAAAIRSTDDLERLDVLLGQAPGWMAPESQDPAVDIAGLGKSERYLLSLLKRPRSLDNVRRAALIDYEDLVRGMALLAFMGMIAPCKTVNLPPPVSSSASAREQGAEAAGGEAAPTTTARSLSGLHVANRRSVREALDALDAAEGGTAMHDLDGSEATGAQRHRVVALLESARQSRDSGGDRRTARQMLGRALDIFPAVAVMLTLAELEIAEPHLRSQGLDRLQRVLAKQPRSTEGWLLLARYWSERQQGEKVRACAAKILAYDPANAQAQELATGVIPPKT